MYICIFGLIFAFFLISIRIIVTLFSSVIYLCRMYKCTCNCPLSINYKINKYINIYDISDTYNSHSSEMGIKVVAIDRKGPPSHFH